MSMGNCDDLIAEAVNYALNKNKKIEDTKKVMFMVGSRDEILAKLNELAKEEKNAETLETVEGIWEAMEIEEKLFVLHKAGYALEI